MQRLVLWIKSHLTHLIIFLVVVWLSWPRLQAIYYETQYGLNSLSYIPMGGFGTVKESQSMPYIDSSSSLPYSLDYAPTESTNRMVSKTASLSMVVKDVSKTQSLVESYVENIDGFLVTSSLTSPTDAPYAFLTLRVPTIDLDETLSYFRSLAFEVTTENVNAQDVTDQYSDLAAHIASLTATKTRYEEIRNGATDISDLVDITNQIVSIQEQIDRYVGQQYYLEQTAKYSLVTIDMSTDELALPYAPENPFRPSVIYKQAVRSLLTFGQAIAEKSIWAGVYSVVWVPLLLVILWWYKNTRPKPALKKR